MSFKFKINNKNWEVKEKSQQEIKQEIINRYGNSKDDVVYFGITCLDTQTIFLDKDLCLDRKRTTLLHELTHCYIGTFITHMDRLDYDEEDIADIVSNSFDIISNIEKRYFERSGARNQLLCC